MFIQNLYIVCLMVLRPKQVTLSSFSIYINLPTHVCCNNKELKPAFLTDCVRGNALLLV